MTSPSRTRRRRWNLVQVAERLAALAKDLRDIASYMRDGKKQDAMRNFQRAGVGYMRDMAIMMVNEMPESEVARHQADELCGAADVLGGWARHPTDRTSNKARAAQLDGVSACVASWAEQIR